MKILEPFFSSLISIRAVHFFKNMKAILYRRPTLYRPNIRFKDMHKGKRCFILCNGPSVNKQDLTPLRNEIVFSVSYGYYHKDFNIIRPKYHCITRVSYSTYLTVKDVIAWFKEMNQGIGDAELFLDVAEEPLVRKNRLFNGRKINYTCMANRFSAKFTKVIDISGIIPAPQSAPIMCLMIAIYMGFEEIYLIGTEHDVAVTGEYKYFYTSKLGQKENPCVNSDGKIKDLESERQGIKKLMEQYRILKRIAENKGITIYNATLGGVLEVYPRVDLAKVLSVKDAQ